MRRQRYDTVAASDEGDADENESNASQSPNRTARGGTSDTRIAVATEPNTATAPETSDTVPLTSDSGTTISGNEDPIHDDSMNVTILDYTHKRWNVSVSNDGTTTVLDLKRAGAVVHQIPVGQQRLIYRGALLNDATLLSSAKITPDAVVHLFPKPRVVVVNHESDATITTNDSEISGGARVPTIVYDQDEVDRRGNILVLSSMDYIEAVNNVKLFSFMLLIVSSMELLNLIALALGDGAAVVPAAAPPPSGTDPYDTIVPFALQTDDFFDDDKSPNSSSSSSSTHPHATFNTTMHDGLDPLSDPVLALLQTWTPLKYFDVILSIVGIYVALMGIKASNANCTATAKIYLYGTCAVAAAWLAYNYTMSLHVDQAIQAELKEGGESSYAETYHISTDDDVDVYDEAFQVMILPAMVWCMCIFRAWQFQNLLSEAEAEAAERIAAETAEAAAADVEMTPVRAAAPAAVMV